MVGTKITELFDVLYIFFQMKSSKFDVNFALEKLISLDQLHFQGLSNPREAWLPYIRQQRFRLSVRSWNPLTYGTQTSWLIGWRSVMALSGQE